MSEIDIKDIRKKNLFSLIEEIITTYLERTLKMEDKFLRTRIEYLLLRMPDIIRMSQEETDKRIKEFGKYLKNNYPSYKKENKFN